MHIKGCHNNIKYRSGGPGLCVILELKRKGNCGLGLKGRKAIPMEMEANVWQINVCWAPFNNGVQRGH